MVEDVKAKIRFSYFVIENIECNDVTNNEKRDECVMYFSGDKPNLSRLSV